MQDILKTGNFNPIDYKVTTRVGGHSLTMDDGDIYNKNNLVRLKTSAGHQIMMNDSEGFMYIANAAGTAWVELTQKGDILIYGAKDMSIRTQGNLMMHSDHNINLNAVGSVNINAGVYAKIQAQAVEALGNQSLNLYGKQAQLASAGTLALRASGSMGIQAGGSIGIKGSGIALQGGGGGTGQIAPPTGIPKYGLPDARFTGGQWQINSAGFSSINYKVPTHEPYARAGIAAIVDLQNQLAEEFAANAAAAGATINADGTVTQPDTSPKTTAGADEAANSPVKRPAPTSAFIKQPDPGQGIGNLDKDQLRAYMAQTSYSESGGDYGAINQFGYAGKYQMGAAALSNPNIGYIKPGTPQTKEAMNNPANWTGKDGIYSFDDFANNPSVQEKAMYNYTQGNYTTLQRNGLITPETPADVTAGLLSASHLVGPGGPNTTKGVYNWYKNGAPASDANGTTAADYFNRGRYSQTQVATITASNNSKTIAGA